MPSDFIAGIDAVIIVYDLIQLYTLQMVYEALLKDTMDK